MPRQSENDQGTGPWLTSERSFAPSGDSENSNFVVISYFRDRYFLDRGLLPQLASDESRKNDQEEADKGTGRVVSFSVYWTCPLASKSRIVVINRNGVTSPVSPGAYQVSVVVFVVGSALFTETTYQR